jgi:RNA polymerase sigma-70 factor (ECF subfamily)
LYRAINQLNKIDRAIILLFLEQKSYQEMSEILGISKSNVSVRLLRAKKRLSAIFKNPHMNKEAVS